MESNLVFELKKQTGASEDLCYSLLQGQGWDLKSALIAYMQLADLAKPDSKEKYEDGSRYNISGSWRATHNKNEGSDCVDGSVISVPVVQPLIVNIDGFHNTKPVLQKADAIDLIDCKKLQRGISRATENENIVSKVRSECAQDVSFNNPSNMTSDQFYIDTPEYTFTLPDITIYSEEFRKFLEKDLLETSTLVSLEQSGRLNWWCRCGGTSAGPLWPLATSGDGNCLPHAASLGLWGFHDRLLTLRRLLHSALLDAPWRHAIRRRWRWTQTRQHTAAGLVLSQEEWQAEWDHVVERAAPAHHSLEEVHVFALAHTLRRPIIVIADVMLRDLNGEAMAPIPFGGVYLPLECSQEQCHKSPLLLAYDMGHFSALVTMDTSNLGKITSSSVVPLTDSDGCLLPIQFSVDPGEDFDWTKDENDPKVINRLLLTERDQINLLSEYLTVIYLSPSSSPGQEEPDLIDLSEEDIINKFSEVLNVNQITDVEQSEQNMFDNKSKAAKQIHSVAKQFGSIGKSMSNKLKKNLGSITKIGSKTNGSNKKSTNNSLFLSQKYKILCCQLKAKRHAIQDEMVKNYLEYAEHRFLSSEQLKDKQDSERKHFEMIKLREQAMLEGPLKCVNIGCDQYGTALTSYMCPNCFQKQRQQELSEVRNTMTSPSRNIFSSGSPRYDTGKSKFYAESDSESHNTVRRMPSSILSKNDQTLYLSKSTFYNDTGKPSLACAKSVNSLVSNYSNAEKNSKHWKNNSSDDLIKLSGEHKREKAKRSTLPSKVHSTVPNYRTGWDSSERISHHPISEMDANVALDIFSELQPCRTPFCVYYGSPLSDYLCSKCCESNITNHSMINHP